MSKVAVEPKSVLNEDKKEFEKRIITTEENGRVTEREFSIHVIKSADDFKLAAEYPQTFYSMKLLGRNQVMRIPLRGVSFGEWEVIDSQYHIPEVSEDADEKEKQKQKDEKSRLTKLRYVKVFELSTGKSITGETEEEKAEWLSDNFGVGELEALFTCILEKSSNIHEGNLLIEYENSSRQSTPVVSEFTGFDDWVATSKIGSIFRMQRPFEDFIVEIPLKQITDRQKKSIDEQTKVPLPPSRPKIDKKTGMQVGAIYDYNNPTFKAQSKLSNRKNIILLFETCLNFSLPGDTQEKKFKWVSDLLLGDVIKIRNFIENEVFGYRSKIDFF